MNQLLREALATATALPKFHLTMEDVGETEVQREREYCWYVQIEDYSQLAKAVSIEDHTQWEIRPVETKRGAIRVRGTLPVNINYEDSEVSPAGEGRYSLTTKVYNSGAYNGVSDVTESTIEIQQDLFDSFAAIAPTGMKKRRFNIVSKVDDSENGGNDVELKWEIDLFFDAEGNYQPWAKIDLETLTKIVDPVFPIAVQKVLGPNDSPEEKAKIRDQYFVTYNSAIKREEPAAEATV